MAKPKSRKPVIKYELGGGFQDKLRNFAHNYGVGMLKGVSAPLGLLGLDPTSKMQFVGKNAQTLEKTYDIGQQVFNKVGGMAIGALTGGVLALGGKTSNKVEVEDKEVYFDKTNAVKFKGASHEQGGIGFTPLSKDGYVISNNWVMGDKPLSSIAGKVSKTYGTDTLSNRTMDFLKSVNNRYLSMVEQQKQQEQVQKFDGGGPTDPQLLNLTGTSAFNLTSNIPKAPFSPTIMADSKMDASYLSKIKPQQPPLSLTVTPPAPLTFKTPSYSATSSVAPKGFNPTDKQKSLGLMGLDFISQLAPLMNGIEKEPRFFNPNASKVSRLLNQDVSTIPALTEIDQNAAGSRRYSRNARSFTEYANRVSTINDTTGRAKAGTLMQGQQVSAGLRQSAGQVLAGLGEQQANRNILQRDNFLRNKAAFYSGIQSAGRSAGAYGANMYNQDVQSRMDAKSIAVMSQLYDFKWDGDKLIGVFPK